MVPEVNVIDSAARCPVLSAPERPPAALGQPMTRATVKKLGNERARFLARSSSAVAGPFAASPSRRAGGAAFRSSAPLAADARSTLRHGNSASGGSGLARRRPRPPLVTPTGVPASTRRPAGASLWRSGRPGRWRTPRRLRPLDRERDVAGALR